MAAGGATDTRPFCGACGWDTTLNANSDQFCDACGADLARFVGPGIEPPSAVTPTPGTGQVSFAFTVNTDADTTESQTSDDGVTWTEWATDTSPTVVSAVAGTTVCIRLRSIVDGFVGPYVESCDVTAA